MYKTLIYDEVDENLEKRRPDKSDITHEKQYN